MEKALLGEMLTKTNQFLYAAGSNSKQKYPVHTRQCSKECKVLSKGFSSNLYSTSLQTCHKGLVLREIGHCFYHEEKCNGYVHNTCYICTVA